MGFDLVSWLKSQIGEYELEIPLLDVANPTADDTREWLITNGLGTYASANIWGANTRRYHGLLVAALDPPVSRHVLLSRIDETAGGVSLDTSFWSSGAVSPEGFRNLVAFTIYPVPTWVFQVGDGYLVKQVAMIPGRQEVVVGYTWTGNKRLDMSLHLIANFRDFHNQTRGHESWVFLQNPEAHRVRVRAFDGAQELVVAYSQGSYRADPCWYWGYFWPRERERGLESSEDNFRIGRLETSLEPGGSLTIRAGLDTQVVPGSIHDVVREVAAHQGMLLARAGSPRAKDVQKLVLAADQFVVKRHSTGGHSIIAGYHWFNDWGRDSMISLPGLTLSTGRPEIARDILVSFGKYASQGMLPNNFPDQGRTPDYNTSDATFWWAWALKRYYERSGDSDFVREQLPLLADVVRWHQRGTRYNLNVDPADGLVTGGEKGVQLTWMDAKCGDYVVTPRQGKAVEINALWYNFLKVLEQLTAITGGDGQEYADLAAKVKVGFASFWNGDAGCLYDVIRDDGSKDASIRPNQLIALSLPFPLVSSDQAKSALSVVERELLTPMGLRTLSPSDSQYQGEYGGGKHPANQWDRDVTYHQGTAWPWLFGPWVDARIAVFGSGDENMTATASKLAAVRAHILSEAGLGSISEIFDGALPQKHCGCIAQAWSVAELLRVLTDYPALAGK